MTQEKKERLASRPTLSAPIAAEFAEPRLVRWLTLTIFFAVLLLNLLLRTKNYYWDGIFFAQQIEDAPRLNSSLVHPNHLLYVPFEYLIYRAVRWAGLSTRALNILQISNCWFSAAAVSVLFRINLDRFRSLYVSLVLTAVFAFSAIWWKFSTDADAYILAVLLLLICCYLLLPEHSPRPFALALVHMLAMFAHQLAVFFFPVALAGLILQSRPTGRARNTLKYGLTVVLLTVAVYCSCFYLVTGTSSLARFTAWMTSFSPEHGFGFNVWTNLVYTLRAQSRVFFGGRLSFIRELQGPLMLGLTTLAILSVTVFLITLLRYPRELKKAIAAGMSGPRRFRPLTVLCAIWIATYVVFLFFFIPQNTFYRLFYLPPIVLLAGTFLTNAELASSHMRRYRAALFAAAMFFANLAFSQYPYTRVRANPPLQLALQLNQTWTPGTTVYFASPNSDESLVRYFNPASIWTQTNPAQLIQHAAASRPSPQRAWLETTMIDALQQTPEGKSWLDAHATRRLDCELVDRKYRIQFRQLKPESFAAR